MKDLFNASEAVVKQVLRIQNDKKTTNLCTKISNKTKLGTV